LPCPGTGSPRSQYTRAQALGNLRSHPLQGGVEEVDGRQLLSEQEALVRSDLASQRLLQLRDLLAQAATSEVGQLPARGVAWDQLRQQLAPRRADDGAGHRRHLAIGPFKHLLPPLPFRRPLLDERGPIAGQLAQLALWSVSNEARPQQAMTRSGSAIHSASYPSVLRPGTAFTR